MSPFIRAVATAEFPLINSLKGRGVQLDVLQNSVPLPSLPENALLLHPFIPKQDDHHLLPLSQDSLQCRGGTLIRDNKLGNNGVK